MSPLPAESPAFETALAELERILRCLEDGSTTLEESLAQYERGVGLLKRCYEQLRSAEQRITLLSGVDAEGRPVLKPFEHAATADSPKPEEKRRVPRPKPKEQDGLY
jgi:exodeoxyribonuclease VII small subunit